MTRHCYAEMPVSGGSDHASARSSAEEADLHEVRFIDILNRYRLFADCRSYRLESHGTAVVVSYHRSEDKSVYRIKPEGIDLHAVERH